jgi:hypothetical protein
MKRLIIGGVLAGIGILFWYHSANEPRTYKNPIWQDIGSGDGGNTIVYGERIYYNPEKDTSHGWFRLVYSKPKYSPAEDVELSDNKSMSALSSADAMPVNLPYPNVTPTVTSSGGLLYVNCTSMNAHILQHSIYAGNSVINTSNVNSPEPYEPGTLGAIVAKFLCKVK